MVSKTRSMTKKNIEENKVMNLNIQFSTVKFYVDLCSKCKNKEDKVIIFKLLFNFLLENKVLVYLYPRFKAVVIDKCIEFQKDPLLKDYIHKFWNNMFGGSSS